MKVLNAVMTGALFSTIVAAQNSSNISTPPDTEILNKSWHREVINPALDKDPFKVSDPFRDAPSPQKQPNPAKQQGENAVKKPSAPRPVQPRAPVAPPSPSVPKGRFETYFYQVKVKNTGDKTIRAVAWEYVFIDPETKKDINRFVCLNKVKINPGKSGDLIMSASTPPSNLIDARKADKGQQRFIEQIVISRIEYSDGSVWQRPQK